MEIMNLQESYLELCHFGCVHVFRKTAGPARPLLMHVGTSGCFHAPRLLQATGLASEPAPLAGTPAQDVSHLLVCKAV